MDYILKTGKASVRTYHRTLLKKIINVAPVNTIQLLTFNNLKHYS